MKTGLSKEYIYEALTVTTLEHMRDDLKAELRLTSATKSKTVLAFASEISTIETAIRLKKNQISVIGNLK